MNRLIIFVASLGLSVVAITSTCMAQPVAIASLAAPSRSVVDAPGGIASSWSASLSASRAAYEAPLSL